MDNTEIKVNSINQMKEEDVKLFLNSKHDYFLMKWEQMDSKGIYMSFNYNAIIFSAFWYMYRKMYMVSLITIGTIYSLKFTHLIFVGKPINLAIILSTYFFMGLYGDFLYKQHATNKLMEIKSNLELINKQDHFLKRQGGTSWLMVFILIIIIIIFEYLYTILADYYMVLN